MVIKKHKLSKKMTIVGLVVIFIFIIGLIYKGYNQDEFIAKVNSEIISADEFNLIINDNIANVSSYFKTEYNADSSEKNYWTSSFGGEIPLEVLKEKTLEKCIDIKVSQILAKEQGLIEDISYSGFLKNLKAENERRKESIKNNEPIYGPVEYKARDYFEYVLTNMVTSSRDYIMNNEITFNDETINRYYEEIKDEYFKIDNTIKVEQIFIPIEDENTSSYKEIEEIVKVKLKNNEDLNDVVDKWNIEVVERLFTPETASEDENKNSELRDVVYNLKEGEVSERVDVGNGYYIIKCVDIKQNGYKKVEDVEGLVKNYYANDKYEEIIAEMKNNVDIDINKKTYEMIGVN